MYNGKGFEMLAALNQHCCPDLVANAFTTLMLLFNDSMGKSEEIMSLNLRFNGMINEMACYKIVILPILMVMFFLCSLPSHYAPLLDQFWLRLCCLETASLDLVVSDVRFHNKFKVIGEDKKAPPGKGPKAVAATASPAVDRQGKNWNNPYEWLSKLNIDSVKRHWKHSLAGNGFCTICHQDVDRHAPVSCPFLVKLSLKLIRVNPPAAGPPAAAPAPAVSPSPGGWSAVANDASALSLTGSANAHSGLVASVTEEYDSDDHYPWDGDECGVEFSVSSMLPKTNDNVALYHPSCNHVVVEALPPPLAPLPVRPLSYATRIVLSKHLTSIIKQMLAASILPASGGRCFTIADSGATDHMFPDKLAFISYKLVSNLQVWMGNNSFLPILGCGLAIILLNGQRVLICNALHVPGLVVPLYSLCAHCMQPGCGFIGALRVGILVYFPSFVLTVDTLKDCHLAFESLGRSALLDTLHSIQPRCAPSLYPSKHASHTASKSPAIIEDNSSASDDADVLTWSYPQPKCLAPPSMPSSPTPPLFNPPSMSAHLNLVSAQLCSLAESISSLQWPVPTPPPGNSPTSKPWFFPVLASTMLREEIILLLHQDGSSLPSVQPCDTAANNLDTKTGGGASSCYGLPQVLELQDFASSES